MKTIISLALIVLFGAVTIGFAQSDLPKVYIPPMEENFDTFLTTAFLRNKLPITVVLEEENADFVIAGASVKGPNKWSDTVFGVERDRTQGSFKLIRVADMSIVWAGTAGDKTVFFSMFRKGGHEKVAERIARKLKKEYFKKKITSISMRFI